MWQLFGIDTTPQDTIDYWDEQNRKFEFDNTFGGKLCIKENYELQIF